MTLKEYDRPGGDENRYLTRALALAEAALADAEAAYHRALTVIRQSLGDGHPEVATLYRHLADLAYRRHRPAEAMAYAQRALDVRTAALGAGHLDVAFDTAALACLLAAEGKMDEAEPLLRRALMTFQTVAGPDSDEVAFVGEELGAVLAALGRPDEARTLHGGAPVTPSGDARRDTGATLDALSSLQLTRSPKTLDE